MRDWEEIAQPELVSGRLRRGVYLVACMPVCMYNDVCESVYDDDACMRA